jgi:hypothetical protein
MPGAFLLLRNGLDEQFQDFVFTKPKFMLFVSPWKAYLDKVPENMQTALINFHRDTNQKQMFSASELQNCLSKEKILRSNLLGKE